MSHGATDVKWCRIIPEYEKIEEYRKAQADAHAERETRGALMLEDICRPHDQD